jgi:hypothetical protein
MTFEGVFRFLYEVGPIAWLTGAIATVLIYFIYAYAMGSARRPFWSYLGASALAACVAYGIGAAIGIAIACSTPKGGNLCGLMGIFGLGPLLAGIVMFTYGCNRLIADCRSAGD